MNELLAKLDELKAAVIAASVPFDRRYLDADGCAAMMQVSTAHFRERIACKPSFPKPRRPTGGHARWKAVEVEAWLDRQTTRAA